MTDPIADMLIRIKNAVLAKHQQLLVPHSKIKQAIVELMVKNGYLESVEVVDKKPQKILAIKLKYVNKLSVITNIKRLSTPGRRQYASKHSLPSTINGYGMTVVSTSKGLMTDKEAKTQSLGGELICQVW